MSATGNIVGDAYLIWQDVFNVVADAKQGSDAVRDKETEKALVAAAGITNALVTLASGEEGYAASVAWAKRSVPTE